MPHQSTTRETPSLSSPLDYLPTVIRAPRTDAIYNCHAYLTKVPVAAIKPFVEALSQPGELVVDMFAGSGMTGLAAASIGRAAALSDISSLGQHIAQGYLAKVDAAALRQAAKAAVSSAKAAIGDLYRTRRQSDGAEVEMIRTIWSFVYACPRCQRALIYFELLDEQGKPIRACPNCGQVFARRSWSRLQDQPMRVVVEGEHGKQVEQTIQPLDFEKISRAHQDPRQSRLPSLPIAADREMFGRSGLARAGICETRQFFSPRNGLALLELWNAIETTKHEAVRRKLRFAFTACLARASRRYQWGPKRPLNAQNQTYYIAPVYFEWNVFELFERKVEATVRADRLLFGGAGHAVYDHWHHATYVTASADALTHLQDASVDYVFTDPPFASNLFYADMSLFHEAWLGRTTDDALEAVMHTTGPRKPGSASRYERILSGAFREAHRVLKPGRFLSVVFGNSSGAAWALLQRALREAGFSEPLHIAILDKVQRSVKGLKSGSEGVVTVDLVLTAQKPVGEPPRQVSPGRELCLREILALAATKLEPDQARNPSFLYAAALREALRLGHRLDGLHFREVLRGLRELGLALDARKGLLDRPLTAEALAELCR